MKNVKFLSYLGGIILALAIFLVPAAANAGNWSVNIGVPVVVAAPPPAVVYSAPAVPVAAVVPAAPVMYPQVSGFIFTQHVVHHHDYRGNYRGRPAHRHRHR